MAGRLGYKEINLRKDDELSSKIARLVVSELIDDNPDTLESTTQAYVDNHPRTGRRHFAFLCGNELVGVGTIRPDKTHASKYFLDGLVVHKDHRHHDYGRVILGLVAQEAMANSAEILIAGTWIPDYFARYGFEGDRREMAAPVDRVINLTSVAQEEVSRLA